MSGNHRSIRPEPDTQCKIYNLAQFFCQVGREQIVSVENLANYPVLKKYIHLEKNVL